MRKRTAVIAAAFTFIPLVQPLQVGFRMLAATTILTLSSSEVKADDAHDLLGLGLDKSDSGNCEGAIKDYTKAINLGVSPSTEPKVYFIRGLCNGELENFIDAIDDFTKAIELYPENELDYKAEAFSNRGFSKHLLNDYRGAINDYTQAIEIDPTNHFVYFRRGNSKGLLNDYQGAIEDHTKAIELNPQYSDAFIQRALAKDIVGDLDGAINDYKSILAFGSKQDVFNSLIGLIDSYLWNDNYKEIPSLINKAKNIVPTLEEGKGVAEGEVLYQEARFNYTIGNKIKAVRLLEEGLKILSSSQKEDHYIAKSSRQLLISTYIDLKEFRKARKLIKRKTWEGQLSLARIASLEGDPAKAERIFKRLYQRQLKEGLEIDPYFLESFGLAYWWQGKNEEAKPLIQKSLEILENQFGANSPNLIQTLINIAMVHYRDKDYEKSAYYLKRSLELQFTRIQERVVYLPTSKRDTFLKTLGMSYPAIFSASAINKDGAKLALFARLNRHGLLEEIEKAQSYLTSTTQSQSFSVRRIKGIINLLSNKKIEIDKETRNNLIDEKERLEIDLYKQLPRLRQQIIEASDIAKVMPENSILIEFQRYNPFKFEKPIDALEITNWAQARYQALILKSNGKIEAIDLGLAEPIENKIQEALSASSRLPEFKSQFDIAEQLWDEVSELIVKPLEDAIGDSDALFVSPDGELNRVPFTALHFHKSEFLLGEVINLRLLTTGRELLDLSSPSQRISNASVIVADPAFNLVKKTNTANLISSSSSQQRSGDILTKNWSTLTGTDKEGKAIQKLIKAELLTRDNATAIAIQQRKKPKVLHIASHSFFLKNQIKNLPNPIDYMSTSLESKNETPLLRSGIVLAGANEPELNPNDDGYLTALEITQLDWNGTELVVISGCESGQGEIKSGEGVYGLKRAISVAGARSSLLSLWKVNDEATAAFMESFYKRLKEGKGRTEALVETQQEFRSHRTNEDWRHPYIWAAFQLSGDWRPIKF